MSQWRIYIRHPFMGVVGGGGGEEVVTPLWSISLVKSTPFRIDPRSALYSTNVRRKAQSGHFILQRS